MLDQLTKRFTALFDTIRQKGRITEEDISRSMREIRLILLDADVNYKIVKEIIEDIEKNVLGNEVLKSLKPEHIIIKAVNDKLVEIMSSEGAGLLLKKNPSIIMLAGLQGTGKTTTAGKLGRMLKEQGRSVLLVPCDIKRPAAFEQLQITAEKAGTGFFEEKGNNVSDVIKSALKKSAVSGYDTLILDTAGRLHVDEEVMQELQSIETMFSPDEVLYVADSMTGQDAVNSAKGFSERIGITGLILTKMDGDQKGGAALSVVKTVGKPIKFVCSGEHLNSIEPFYPERMVSRILGMGDIVTLVERTQENIEKEKGEQLQKKMLEGSFDFEDYLEQIKMIRKMGPLKDVLSMIPGVGAKVKLSGVEEKQMMQIEAIISSMTPRERKNPVLLNNRNRIRRIAFGSGTSVAMVKFLLKQHKDMKKMMNMMKKGGFNMGGFGL